MATFVHGIGASENIDSSGEVVSIAGLDISSLPIDGVLNWEHKKDLPAQIVGKILKAKKIFSEQDCEDEHQLYFWQKVLTPYVYILAELMDDYKESAKEVAGMFRYDADRKGKQERNVANFSIEGSKIEKQGNTVLRSIGRKVTITPLPCNKAAIAEIVPSDVKGPKDDIDSLFAKSEDPNKFHTKPGIEIELFKNEAPMEKALNPKDHAGKLGVPAFGMAQPATVKPPVRSGVSPSALKAPSSTLAGPAKSPQRPLLGDKPALPSLTTNPGSELGATKSGKKVFAHAKIHEYHGFSMADHDEAAGFHRMAAEKTKDPKMAQHHLDKMKLHLQAARTAERKDNRFAVGRQQAANRALGKATTAGSALAAPGNREGMAALKKSEYWFERATQAYENWEKKEEFRTFMKNRMPHLALGEIDAIGKTLALKKSIDAEQALATLVEGDENKE